MRVVIAGSRDFGDYEFLKNKCIECIGAAANKRDVQIVSGRARGADRLGERFANEFGLSLAEFAAHWDQYGKSAGYIRNEQMARYAANDNGHLIAFWDGESKGTLHMIKLAKKHGLKVHTFIYKE